MMTGNASTRSVGTEASGRSEPKSPTPMGGASVSEVLAAAVPVAAKAEKPIKAYIVQEEDEGTGGVVFAKTNAQARRIGAHEYGDGDWDSVVCRRAPWADEYVAAGHVPTRAYLQMGWYWECTGCELRMSEDAEAFEH